MGGICEVKMGSGNMIHVPSFIKMAPDIQKFIEVILGHIVTQKA
jgi:hypothetical protein